MSLVLYWCNMAMLSSGKDTSLQNCYPQFESGHRLQYAGLAQRQSTCLVNRGSRSRNPHPAPYVGLSIIGTASVLKTVRPFGRGGSSPSSDAIVCVV